MTCPECEADIGDPVDATYCNYDSPRVEKGRHTGNIYYCEACDVKWLDNFLTGQIEIWHG
jgi:hypothetical protein